MFRKTIKFLTIRVDQFNRFAILVASRSKEYHLQGPGSQPNCWHNPRGERRLAMYRCTCCLALLRREAFARPPPT